MFGFFSKLKLNAKFTLYCLFTISLITLDFTTSWLTPIRPTLGYVTESFYIASHFPQKIWNDLQIILQTNQQLRAENIKLQQDWLLTQAKLQKFATLEVENTNLRKLLNSSAVLDESVLVSELIGLDPNINVQKIIINKGTVDGVFEGQVAIDAKGVIGQVVEVMPHTARVLLLSDATHAIPVIVMRNGLRGVVAGSASNQLEMLYVAQDADIKEGDVLVSSGLGLRFPPDYPVADVVQVTHSPNQIFAEIKVKPIASLNQARYVLLVLP